jgi:hypothetical protein
MYMQSRSLSHAKAFSFFVPHVGRHCRRFAACKEIRLGSDDDKIYLQMAKIPKSDQSRNRSSNYKSEK